MRYMHQKTNQMGIPKIFAYNISQNYPITIYSISLKATVKGFQTRPNT